jgi:hypothetical protein
MSCAPVSTAVMSTVFIGCDFAVAIEPLLGRI